jgi:cytochrome c oxidase subunit 2
VPFIIVVLMALPATKAVVAMKDTTNADLTIKVTGYQWKWGYDYVKGPGEGISFLSTLSTPRDEVMGKKPITETYLQEVDNPLVVPVNKKIRIITTANDVVHSWYVPAFGVKQDAIPGFVRDTWFKADKVGTFRGFCTELCGKEHAFMPVVVEVLSDEDYAKWVSAQKGKLANAAVDPNKVYTMAELVAHGEEVYKANCAACHQVNGKGLGAFPAMDGSAIVNGPIAGHVERVLHGKGAMPSWASLSDLDIASVITYERNSWGNHKNDLLQPKQVADARNGKMPEDAAGAAAPADAASAPAQAASGAAAAGRSGGSVHGLLRNGQERAAGRREGGDRRRGRLCEGASGREARAVGLHRQVGLGRRQCGAREAPRASRARCAEGCRRGGRPHCSQEAGNDHGRRRREGSAARRDRAGGLTCR